MPIKYTKSYREKLKRNKKLNQIKLDEFKLNTKIMEIAPTLKKYKSRWRMFFRVRIPQPNQKMKSKPKYHRCKSQTIQTNIKNIIFREDELTTIKTNI